MWHIKAMLRINVNPSLSFHIKFLRVKLGCDFFSTVPKTANHKLTDPFKTWLLLAKNIGGGVPSAVIRSHKIYLIRLAPLIDLFEQLVNELWQESDIHVMLQIWEHFGPQLIEFVQSLLFDFEAFFA